MGSVSPLSFTSLRGHFARLSPLGKAALGLAFALEATEARQASPAALSAEAADAVRVASDWLLGNMRVLGRTAYVTAGGGSAFSAGGAANALALLLLVESHATHPLVPKLAAGVAGAERSSICSAPLESALSALALARYDMARGSNAPNLRLTVTAGAAAGEVSAAAPATTVLDHTFAPQQQSAAAVGVDKSASAAAVSVSVPLEAKQSALDIDARGTGEVSVAVAMSFVPATLLPFPTYRGLLVEKTLTLSRASAGHTPTASALLQMPSSTPTVTAPVASVVTVTIQVTTPDDVSDLVVLDLPPAGLEPVDPNLPQSSTSPSADVSPYATSPWSWGWWGPSYTQVTRPASVRFHFPYLPAGTHTVSYQAVAVTPGAFALPPAKASLLRQPEVMGLSPAGSFWVLSEGEKEPAESRAAGRRQLHAVPPKRCPNDCSGSGMCNLATGACICDRLFAGADCSLFTGKAAPASGSEGSSEDEPGNAPGSSSSSSSSSPSSEDAFAHALPAPSLAMLLVAATVALLPFVLLALASRVRIGALAARLAGYRVVQQSPHGVSELSTLESVSSAAGEPEGESSPMLVKAKDAECV
eukprot:TRINITY_DN4847_c0_g1_i3.p1 TRINITY_DN4847_c0_g1~~TRINITY_DN4847_c0_g1_i3.p1  ORF type:complete len:632 (-),score=3.31 TRINITY_DN4847_c0_g1_i3:151-1914(-)